MSYRMAGGVFGELQNSFDREDAAYADKYKTDLSTALANRNAYAAAQQEALRQAQLAEAYDFQDLQNQQIQKQRALENAMGGRRQLQHEYEFGEKMKAEAAANKLWQENERLRIGEQKAREADRMAQQESKEFLRLLDYSKNPQASYSDFTSAYDEMPYLQGDRWQKLMSNLQETQKEVAALDQARARQAKYWSQMALDASRAPLTPEAKQKAVNDFYAPIMKSKGFHENFYIDDDWTVKPLPVRRPTDALTPQMQQAAPRPEAPPQVPQSAPRAEATRQPGTLDNLSRGLFGANLMEDIYSGRVGEDGWTKYIPGAETAGQMYNALPWARTQQQRTGLKSLGDAISTSVPTTRLTDAAAGAALAPSMGGGTERNAELGVKQARWLADRAKDFVMQKAREVVAGRIALPPGSAMAAPIFVAAKLIQDGMWDAAEKISEQAAEEQFWQHRLDAGGRTVSGDEMLQLTQQAAAEGRL